MKIQFVAGKLLNGKIVEVLGHSDKGIAVCYEVYSDNAYEMRQYLPTTTPFIWVRTFSFNLGDIHERQAN